MFAFTIVSIFRHDETQLAILIKPNETNYALAMTQLSHILTGLHDKSDKVLIPTRPSSLMHQRGANRQLYICFAEEPESLDTWIMELQLHLPPQYNVVCDNQYITLKLSPPQEGSFNGICIGVSTTANS